MNTTLQGTFFRDVRRRDNQLENGKGISRCPSALKLPCIKNGLEKMGEAGIKTMFAASTFSNPVERMYNSTSPPLNVSPMYSGMQRFVMGGNSNVSNGNKTQGLCATKYCMFVGANFHASEIIKYPPTSCHLAESRPHFHSFGKPTAASRSVILTAERFSAEKLKISFDCPSCTGITRHPLTKLFNMAAPSGRSPTFTIRLANKKSFVKNTLESGESPICKDNTRCGFGSGGSGRQILYATPASSSQTITNANQSHQRFSRFIASRAAGRGPVLIQMSEIQ